MEKKGMFGGMESEARGRVGWDEPSQEEEDCRPSCVGRKEAAGQAGEEGDCRPDQGGRRLQAWLVRKKTADRAGKEEGCRGRPGWGGRRLQAGLGR